MLVQRFASESAPTSLSIGNARQAERSSLDISSRKVGTMLKSRVSNPPEVHLWRSILERFGIHRPEERGILKPICMQSPTSAACCQRSSASCLPSVSVENIALQYGGRLTGRMPSTSAMLVQRFASESAPTSLSIGNARQAERSSLDISSRKVGTMLKSMPMSCCVD